MSTLRDRLRTLPAFPPDLPVLDPDDVPEGPDALFASWLEDAIAAGGRQPHAMAFATLTSDGTPVCRTLILKDMDDEGYHLSTHRTSKKGIELAADARASMLFFWREAGRQVRVTGEVVALSDEASQEDWRSRPSYTGVPNPDWQAYALRPTEFEFMQAREDRNHTRVGYRRSGDGWIHVTITTPAG